MNPRDPMNLEQKKRIERMLAEDAGIEIPMDEAYYDRLHDKIMAAVEETEIKPRPWTEKPLTLLRGHWRSWAAAGGSLMGLFLTLQMMATYGGFSLEGSHTAVAARNEDRLLVEVLKNPDAFSRTMFVSRSEEDFFIDVAGESLENLTNDKFNQMMGGKSAL